MSDFEGWVELSSERLGGAVLLANDEFFAPKENLLRPEAAEWREGEYTERGKWMDGWETRRRRDHGHDWCILRLGAPGMVRGVMVDTAFFRGNFPQECSLEVCEMPAGAGPEALTSEEARWEEVLPRLPLSGDAQNPFLISTPRRATHLRFHIYPDGGVARLRVYGDVSPRWTRFALNGGEVDLAALENGGRVVAASDAFFGDRNNLILPGRSTHMGDGWETRRRRGPGQDWIVVRLAAESAIHRIEIDTDHFKGNAPDRCSVEGIHAPGHEAEALSRPGAAWRPLLAEAKLQPHARHRFEEDELAETGPITHARLSIYPDGGIARLRMFGTLPRGGR
jgi:allantoicase